MITLNKLVYDIMELLRNNNITDDIDIDERHVIYHINTQRALWIRNELNKSGRTIDHNIVQDLGCVKVTEADPADCCETDLDGCIVLRTEKQIPNTIELHNTTSITRVGPVDKTDISFSFVPYERSIYSGNSKYSKKQVYSYLLNNYIYLKAKDSKDLMLDFVNIRGIFEDPTEVNSFLDCDNKPCFTNDSKYPINSWMIPYIKEQVLAQFGAAVSMPKDDSNNASENLRK
jgi:hypothetical protein